MIDIHLHNLLTDSFCKKLTSNDISFIRNGNTVEVSGNYKDIFRAGRLYEECLNEYNKQNGKIQTENKENKDR